MERAIPPSVASQHLPLKGGDRFEFAAARCCKRSIYRFRAVGGDRRFGELPISPLVGEMSAKLTEGGENHGCQNSGGNICVH
jgi:hypothetical protein